MATGIEPFVPKLTAFFLGIAQRCVVAAIKKWKETADKAKEEAAAKQQQEPLEVCITIVPQDFHKLQSHHCRWEPDSGYHGSISRGQSR